MYKYVLSFLQFVHLNSTYLTFNQIYVYTLKIFNSFELFLISYIKYSYAFNRKFISLTKTILNVRFCFIITSSYSSMMYFFKFQRQLSNKMFEIEIKEQTMKNKLILVVYCALLINDHPRLHQTVIEKLEVLYPRNPFS